MKTGIVLAWILLSGNLSFGQVVFSDWLVGAGTKGWDIVNDIVCDGSGNIYITGSIGDTAGKSLRPAASGARKKCLFISRYDTSGQLIWSKNILPQGAGYGSRLAIAGSNQILLAGGVEPGNSNQDSPPGKCNFFITSLDNSGKTRWTSSFKGVKTDYITSMRADTLHSEIIVTGYFQDTLTISGETYISHGGTDGFLLRFDLNGVYKKIQIIGGKGDDNLCRVEVSDKGERYAAGTFHQTLRFTEKKSLSLPDSRSEGCFMAKYSPAGDLMDTKQLVFGKKIRINGLVRAGAILYLAGSFSDDLTVDNQVLHSAGSDDIFLLCLDTTLQIRWVKQFGGIRKDRVAGMIYTGKELLLAGSFCSEMRAGQITLKASGEGSDLYLLAIDTTGTLQWMRSAGGEADDYPAGLAYGAGDYIYMAGSYRKSLSINSQMIKSKGEEDIFICRMENCRIHAPVFNKPEHFCAGSQLKLDAKQGFAYYNWENGLGREPVYTVNKGGNITLELIASNGCMLYDTIGVMEVPKPVVNLGNDTTIADTSRIILNAGNGFAHYLWSNGNTNAENPVRGADLTEGPNRIKVTVISENRCVGNDDIVISMFKTLPSRVSELVAESCLVFPNPTRDQVTVSFTLPLDWLVLTIHDPMGKELITQSVSGYLKNTPLTINLGSLPAGIYLLYIKTNRGTATRKIVLQ